MRKFFIYLILFLFAINNSFATESIFDINNLNQDSVSLTKYLAVFEDSGATLTLKDIQQPEISRLFQYEKNPNESLNYGYTKSAYWIRLTLRNTHNQSIERMLEISDARLTNIQFYMLDVNHNYSVIETGLAKPFSTRPYKNRYFVFPITLPANSEKIYYLRIKSVTATQIPIKLWTKQAFHIHERNDYQIQALYFGMVGTMVLFNLLLFVLLRDSIYLLYINSCFFIALSTAAYNGLFKEFLFPNSGFWTNKTLPLLGSLFVISFLIFMRAMLNTKAVVPKLDVIIKTFILFYLIIILSLIAQLPIPQMLIVKAFLVTPALFMTICVVCSLKKQRSTSNCK